MTTTTSFDDRYERTGTHLAGIAYATYSIDVLLPDPRTGKPAWRPFTAGAYMLQFASQQGTDRLASNLADMPTDTWTDDNGTAMPADTIAYRVVVEATTTAGDHADHVPPARYVAYQRVTFHQD